MNFEDFVKDKNVILVGPSPSIIGSGKGPIIDGYDIVVRMNKAVPPCPDLKNDIGTRTDILYNCLEPHPNSGGTIDPIKWKNNGVKYVCSPYPETSFAKPNIERFKRLNINSVNLPFRMVDWKMYHDLVKELDTRPNTGLLAICDLLRQPIKQLRIIGITFGMDGYYKEYNDMSLENYKKMANGPNHQQEPQFKYFCQLCKHDSRILPCFTLQKLIKEEWKNNE